MAADNDWQDRGACRGMEVEMFFPVVEHEAFEAKRVCAMCPVQAACLEFALMERERFGIWGGLTTQERRDLLRERRTAVELGAALSDPTPVPG